MNYLMPTERNNSFHPQKSPYQSAFEKHRKLEHQDKVITAEFAKDILRYLPESNINESENSIASDTEIDNAQIDQL